MKDTTQNRWQITLGAALLALSAAFYGLHYLAFHDAHHIFIYLVGDIAFVFIEVLLVTLIIHRVLENKQRRERLEKLNMVIGSFFSEVGTALLSQLAAADAETGFNPGKGAAGSLSEQFRLISDSLKARHWKISTDKLDWSALKDLLSRRRAFLLGLLQNQNLLEHESFTDVLWSIFHLTEELEARPSSANLPEPDINHLRVDMERAYRATGLQWTGYMQHLKTAYPYLFSLAVRINPFTPGASAVIEEHSAGSAPQTPAR